MNDTDLSNLLRHAASAMPLESADSLQSDIMARVKVDEGRAQRWRSFVRWLLLLAAISGVLTAAVICWSLASRDTTHALPPAMNLLREEGRAK